MAGGAGKGNGAGGGGKGHKQATPDQIAKLRRLLSDLEATDANVLHYRWLTDDRMLHRFITARNGNVEVALKMLLEHLVRLFLVPCDVVKLMWRRRGPRNIIQQYSDV